MLGTCEQRNSSNKVNKMDFGSWVVQKKVNDFLRGLHAFERLAIDFCRAALLPKNPKISDYQHALQTFHNQFYHKFLYHNTHRTPECRAFIKHLKEFEAVKKPKKEEYVQLFDTLRSFQKKELPGGHWHTIPFVLTDQCITKWFHDEVCAGNKLGDTVVNAIVSNGTWTGHTKCPANRISKPSPHLVHIELNTKQLQTLSKIQKDQIQWNKDFVAHMDADEPYKAIQLEHLQRTQEHVKSINSKYEELSRHYEELSQQNTDLKHSLVQTQQINHRQFNEINGLRYALDTKLQELSYKNNEIIYKNNELFHLKNKRVRYT